MKKSRLKPCPRCTNGVVCFIYSQDLMRDKRTVIAGCFCGLSVEHKTEDGATLEWNKRVDYINKILPNYSSIFYSAWNRRIKEPK